MQRSSLSQQSLRHHPMSANPTSPQDQLECACCLTPQPQLATLPCCEREGSSTSFCYPCLVIICQDGVGKCPKCRSYITCHNGEVTKAEAKFRCRTCRQLKIIVDPRSSRCDACSMGQRHCFTYECSRCHKSQRIPHPMWLYQPTPQSYGTATWACHNACRDYTHWRIVDPSNVPFQERPPSWGGDGEWMESVRNVRREQIIEGRGSRNPTTRDDDLGGAGCNVS
jgi:hypothetical protein